MEDRLPLKPNRMLITPENGAAPYYATVTRADEPTQEGTPLNKATFWPDEVAELMQLDKNTLPKDGFKRLYEYTERYRAKIGDLLYTVNPKLPDGFVLTNGAIVNDKNIDEYPDYQQLIGPNKLFEPSNTKADIRQYTKGAGIAYIEDTGMWVVAVLNTNSALSILYTTQDILDISDSSQWTVNKNVLNVSPGERILSILYNNGRYVIFITDGNLGSLKIASSTDLQSWSKVSPPDSILNSYISQVFVHDNIMYLLGVYNNEVLRLWKNSDPADLSAWTQITSVSAMGNCCYSVKSPVENCYFIYYVNASERLSCAKFYPSSESVNFAVSTYNDEVCRNVFSAIIDDNGGLLICCGMGTNNVSTTTLVYFSSFSELNNAVKYRNTFSLSNRMSFRSSFTWRGKSMLSIGPGGSGINLTLAWYDAHKSEFITYAFSVTDYYQAYTETVFAYGGMIVLTESGSSNSVRLLVCGTAVPIISENNAYVAVRVE